MKKIIMVILFLFLVTSQILFGAGKASKDEKTSDDRGAKLSADKLSQSLSFISRFSFEKQKENKIMIGALLKSKPQVNAVFLQRARIGYVEVLEVIVTFGGDEKMSNHVITPESMEKALEYAVQYGYEDVVGLLTMHKYANVLLTTKQCVLALEVVIVELQKKLPKNKSACKAIKKMLVTYAKKTFSDEDIQEACGQFIEDERRRELVKILLRRPSQCVML
jgi:hypothetical protein